MNIVLLAESLNYKETGKDYDEVSSLNEVSRTHVNLDTSVMLGIRAQHSRECHSPHLLLVFKMLCVRATKLGSSRTSGYMLKVFREPLLLIIMETGGGTSKSKRLAVTGSLR